MDEPFSGTPSEALKKREAIKRRLVKAYKGTFASEHGRLVLADLKQRFGFDRWEAESETLTDNQIARRTCMKGPIFHIERMRSATLRKEPKPQRALSANHHEQSNPPPT